MRPGDGVAANPEDARVAVHEVPLRLVDVDAALTPADREPELRDDGGHPQEGREPHEDGAHEQDPPLHDECLREGGLPRRTRLHHLHTVERGLRHFNLFFFPQLQLLSLQVKVLVRATKCRQNLARRSPTGTSQSVFSDT